MRLYGPSEPALTRDPTASQGSQQIYDKLVVPLIRPYERPLDLIGFVTNEVLDLFLVALIFLPKYAARKLKARSSSQDVSRRQTGPRRSGLHRELNPVSPRQVPAILRGLRQPHHSKLAASLADSIERSQDDTSAISARFSQPVRARSQPLQVRSQPVPFKPRRAGQPELTTSQNDHYVATRPPSAVAPTSQEPHVPPPPVASTAPFRPVPIIKGSQIPRPSTQEVAQEAFEVQRRAREDALVGQQAVSSIYPSLAEVSTPLSIPRGAVSPSLESSTTTPARHRSPAEAKHGSRAEDGRVGTVSSSSPRNKRHRATPRRTAQVAIHSQGSVATSSKPSSPTSAVSGPPPTPAPPGAFNFRSPNPTPETATNVAEAATSPTHQGPFEMSVDDEHSTPSRRSSRHSTATPRASRTRTSSRLSAVAPPDEATESQISRRKRSAVASVSTTTTPERPSKRTAQDSKTAAAGTPRQRALGAIAQLSKDLLSEDAEPEPSTLGLAGRKKAGSGVLGRSVRGAGPAAPPPRRTARGRGRTAGDSVEGGASDEDRTESGKGVSGSAKVSPQKRKLGDEVDSEGDGRGGNEVRRPAKKSATAKKGASGPSTVPSLAASRSRLPAKSTTSVVAGQNAAESTKPAASTSGSKTRRITAENATSVPAPRRARRILLGRAGPGAAEEEEEIDGVPVVARRRRPQL